MAPSSTVATIPHWLKLADKTTSSAVLSAEEHAESSESLKPNVKERPCLLNLAAFNVTLIPSALQLRAPSKLKKWKNVFNFRCLAKKKATKNFNQVENLYIRLLTIGGKLHCCCIHNKQSKASQN